MIVLGFPLLDLYATVRVARWTNVPAWAWLGLPLVAGFLLLRNERLAFRARTIAAMHGEESLLRGLVDSGRKVLAGFLLLLPGVISESWRWCCWPCRSTSAAASTCRTPPPAARVARADDRSKASTGALDAGAGGSRYATCTRSTHPVGSRLAGAAVRPDHHHDARGDHRQRQPLAHRETEREEAEEAVGLAREFGDEAARSVADEEQPRRGAQSAAGAACRATAPRTAAAPSSPNW